ncbi:MAG: ABC transporter substrate-binding protein [Sulfuritalea sp.]|nr:ABC transporter substrate-binding protein [Sulfuritalea sp.]
MEEDSHAKGFQENNRYIGTGATVASLPQITAHRIPVVGALSGSDGLRDPKLNLIFHTRASYGAETDKMVEQLKTTGVKSIAVVYQDDPFGKAGLKSAQGAFERQGIKPIIESPIDMGKLDAHGIVIAQVVPSPLRASYRISKEFTAAAKKAGSKDTTYNSMEGYITAKVFVEALRRAGKDLTREKLIAALESMNNYDLGDFVIDYSGGKRIGSIFVDLSIISKSGQFLH